jgi:hypothetical protein
MGYVVAAGLPLALIAAVIVGASLATDPHAALAKAVLGAAVTFMLPGLVAVLAWRGVRLVARRLAIAVAALAVSVIVSGDALALSCHYARGFACGGCEATAYVKVRRGATCPFQFIPGNNPTERMEVTRPPKNGTVRVKGVSALEYRFDRVGRDSFQVRVHNRRGDNGQPSSFVVNYDVEVVEGEF